MQFWALTGQDGAQAVESKSSVLQVRKRIRYVKVRRLGCEGWRGEQAECETLEYILNGMKIEYACSSIRQKRA